MRSTICFDRIAEAKKILKNGIGATSIKARSEMRTAAWYLLTQTTYTARQVENRLRSATSEYFKGMTDDYISSSLRTIIASVDKDTGSGDICSDTPKITIYQEELNKIAELAHDDTERLAFVFLCIAKLKPYNQIYECNAELYRLAWKYKYDSKAMTVLEKLEKRRVGGSEPTKRVNALCKAGIVKYSTRINTSYNLTHEKPPASSMFTVPITRNDGEIAFTIDNPDADSLVLYYDQYKGYSGIVTCKNCGRPVLRTGRRQKYCSACHEAINHRHEKAAS